MTSSSYEEKLSEEYKKLYWDEREELLYEPYIDKFIEINGEVFMAVEPEVK